MTAYSDYTAINLDKAEVARRQLREAIILFLEKRDIVSVHTLATAAYQILYDIAKKQGLRDILYDSDIFKDEYRGQAKKHINIAKNFFKHADKDHDEKIKFNSSMTEWFLFSAAYLVRQIYGDMYPENYVFVWWYAINHPEFLKDGDYKESVEYYLKTKYQKDKFDRCLINIINKYDNISELREQMKNYYGWSIE
ncbi:MAG: hypothetical protein ACYSTN_09705 [Planctomycetota bacterium]|jgi:hypothetical protein